MTANNRRIAATLLAIAIAAPALAQDAPAAQPSQFVRPDWVRKPTALDMANVYPQAALKDELAGRAVIDCVTTVGGELQGCAVSSETPPDLGFGEAALKLAPFFQMRPPTRDGVPYGGAKVRLPIVFALGDQLPLSGAFTRPIWAQQATAAQTAAVYPPAALAARTGGRAEIACRMTDAGALSDCKINSQTPQGLGFGEAALGLMPLFTVRPQTAGGMKTAGGYLFLPAIFTVDAAGTPGVAVDGEIRPSVITRPRWVRTPTGNDVGQVYPRKAQRQGVEGRAVMRCTVADTGFLTDCKIVSETPPGFGFGEAALKLGPFFQMQPSTLDGAPIKGAMVTLPINFSFH